MAKNNHVLIKINALVFFIVMIVINYVRQDQISAIAQSNKPFIQPAGYTFAIWSLIYIWLFAWLIYSFFKSAPSNRIYNAIKYWLPLNFTFNALWVLTYTSKQFLLSCICIVVVLVTMSIIYLKLQQFDALSWLFTGVFSVYLGWITVASIVNIFFFVNTLSPSVWTNVEQLIYTFLAILIIVLFTIYMLINKQDILIPLTVIWSLVGIAFNQASQLLSIVSLSSAVLILLTIIYAIISRRK